MYGALQAYNPNAIWVMQGWLFVNDPSFWHQQCIKDYLDGVPNDGMLILDLWSEVVPVYSQTNNYYGKPFVWCVLHNFGGNRALYGNLTHIGLVRWRARLFRVRLTVSRSQTPNAARTAINSTMVGTGCVAPPTALSARLR